jgi:hypothetical protein
MQFTMEKMRFKEQDKFKLIAGCLFTVPWLTDVRRPRPTQGCRASDVDMHM